VVHAYQMTEPVQSSFTEGVHYAVLSGSCLDFTVCYPVFPGCT